MRYPPGSFSNLLSFPPRTQTTNDNDGNNNSNDTSNTEQELSQTNFNPSNCKKCLIIPRSGSNILTIPIFLGLIKFINWVIIDDESIFWDVLKGIYRFRCYVLFYFNLDWSALNRLFSWWRCTQLKENILLIFFSCCVDVETTLVSWESTACDPGNWNSFTVYYATCGVWTRVRSCVGEVLGCV